MKIMQVLKKLIFSIPFLLLFYTFVYELSPFMRDINLIFSFDVKIFVAVTVGLLALLFALMFFAIFVTLSQDWRLILPIAVVASLAPVIFMSLNIGLIIAGGFLLSFLINYYFLNSSLRSYVTFQPSHLLVPSVNTLAIMLILFLSIGYYIVASQEVAKNGFSLPSSLTNLIGQLPKLMGAFMGGQVQGVSVAQIPALDPSQIQYFKDNPDILKKYGVDPSLLDSIPTTATSPDNTITTLNSGIAADTANAIFKGFIKPYLKFIPPMLAIFFFLSIQGYFSMLNFIFLLPLIIRFIFWILEKTGFAKFTTEMRPVKKLIIE